MSKLIVKLTISAIFVVASVTNAVSKEWRGIVPMHSTRDDVVRTLDQCRDSNPSCEFTLEDEFVHIEFAGHNELHQCQPQVHPDTVLLVEVSPRSPSSPKKFGLNARSFKTIKLPLGRKGFVDEASGLVLKLDKGKIIQADYVAALADRTACRSYYENLTLFIQDIFSSHVPVIYVTCPSHRPLAGEKVQVSADVAGHPKISFLWTVSPGVIIAGQGTRIITIDTTGQEGQTILATAKLGRVQASCEVQVTPR